MSWLKNIFGKHRAEEKDQSKAFVSVVEEIKSAVKVDDGHYTDSVEKIKSLKRDGKNTEAIEVLLKCVDATENEAKSANSQPPVLDDWFAFLEAGRSDTGRGVAPWYYEQLAILYRKEKQYNKEVEILERYEKQSKALGVGPQKLAERLIKAKELARKNA
ncbi:MAG: hypothetical protein Q7L07_03695 [Pseudohongiella sp.]|nr:hypothetical protein [Pseudohongiella sp.]